MQCQRTQQHGAIEQCREFNLLTAKIGVEVGLGVEPEPSVGPPPESDRLARARLAVPEIHHRHGDFSGHAGNRGSKRAGTSPVPSDL